MRVPSFVRAAGVLVIGLVVTIPTPATALRLTCCDGDPNTVVRRQEFPAEPRSF
jgi:hypothetical protein